MFPKREDRAEGEDKMDKEKRLLRRSLWLRPDGPRPDGPEQKMERLVTDGGREQYKLVEVENYWAQGRGTGNPGGEHWEERTTIGRAERMRDGRAKPWIASINGVYAGTPEEARQVSAASQDELMDTITEVRAQARRQEREQAAGIATGRGAGNEVVLPERTENREADAAARRAAAQQEAAEVRESLRLGGVIVR